MVATHVFCQVLTKLKFDTAPHVMWFARLTHCGQWWPRYPGLRGGLNVRTLPPRLAACFRLAEALPPHAFGAGSHCCARVDPGRRIHRQRAELSGQRASDRPGFDGVGRSNDLTDASRDLRSKLEAIRFVAKEMAVHPGPALVKSFGDHLGIAVKSLEEIQKNGDPEDTRTIPHILRTVSGLKENFASLVEAQELVGYSDKQGLNGQLNEAAAKVEQTIKASSWLPLVDAQKLSISVLSMRRFEAEYKLRRENAARKDYFAEVDNFNKALDELLNPR